VKVLVTGGSGFLGSHLLPALKSEGHEVHAPTHGEMDCRSAEDLDRIGDINPDCIVHLAARVGGIGANQKAPADFLRDNALMSINVVDAAHRWRVPRLVCLGSVCAYPKHAPLPFKEESFWDGYPEETNAAYGVAKRLLLEAMSAYKRQHGLSGVYLIPTNLYGPGDHANLDTSHVIPALIRKFVEADGEVTLWGTGTPTRDFLYVTDCAEAVVKAVESGCEGMMNLGSGVEHSIMDVAEMVRGIINPSIKIRWDRARPDGQPRRCVDASRAKAALGWTSQTTLYQGLMATVAAYQRMKA
jgi:nucleoside-diphosphate-sugar epimerase